MRSSSVLHPSYPSPLRTRMLQCVASAAYIYIDGRFLHANRDEEATHARV